MQSVKVLADTRGKGRCKHESCGAVITWAEVVESKKRMPFDGDPVPLRTSHTADGRLVEELDAADVHWRTCPGAAAFRRQR